MEKEERQKALYDFLLKNGNNYIYQSNLADQLYWLGITSDYLVGFGNAESYHDTNGRKIMGADIQAINSSPDFEKIIISNGNGVKIATEEDYDKMIKSLYRAVFAKLKRIRTIEKKAKRNGQITMDKKEIIAFLENE